MSQLEPTTQAFIDSLAGATPIFTLSPEATLPVVIYTHGGGWVLGDRETHDRLVRELTVGANAVVVQSGNAFALRLSR